MSSVMEECGAVSLGQGIPFHILVKRKRRAGGEGRGWVELGLFLRRLRGGRCVPVAYFQFLETPDKLSLLKVTLLQSPNHMST